MNAVLAPGPSLDDAIFDELLRAISEVLDIRTIFPRVSEVVSRILPHDCLTMTFHDDDGGIAIEAVSTDDFPRFDTVTVNQAVLRTLNQPNFISDNLLREPLPVTTPRDLNDRITARGYRSVLSVHLRALDKAVGLAFWSKRVQAFSVNDIGIARRVASYVAVAVSHQQLAELGRQRAEARARAENLDASASAFIAEPDARSGCVVGQSEQWKEIVKRALQVSATETTVLLSGESGTGKEVIARLIHRASRRRERPFVAINCAALPDQLLESELFGHERGAFTDAVAAKPGQFELASGGVLFLDEVTEMSLSAQSKFLRALQEREFQRLGGTRLLKANIRVIAATNRDLRTAVESGAFRDDLYYRLQVFEIHLPPLRERRADILPLAESFLLEIGRSLGRPPSRLSREATRTLLTYAWPGNIRELRNALERGAIVAEGGPIAVEHLSLREHSSDAEAFAAAATTNLNVIEHQAIARALRDVRGNKSAAARRLGLSRTQLYVRLRKYRLDSTLPASTTPTERFYNAR